MRTSRRSFLGKGVGAGLSIPLLIDEATSLSSQTPASARAVSKDSSFDPWVEISRENLRHNVQEISRRVGARPILAVIKNNGYGTGVTLIAHF